MLLDMDKPLMNSVLTMTTIMMMVSVMLVVMANAMVEVMAGHVFGLTSFGLHEQNNGRHTRTGRGSRGLGFVAALAL